jgi:membrane associated rhomboid family serine protease
VATLLLALHFLAPPEVRARLAFDYVAFDPLTLLTSAYVHATDAHLFGNLFGYGIGAVYAYGLCVRSGRRAWFRRTVVLLFFVLPVAVNLVSYVALTVQFPNARPVSRGFSGVVGGFGGFLLVALYATIRERDGVRTAVGVLVAMLLVGVATVELGRGAFDPVTLALVVAGVALALFGAGTSDVLETVRTRRRDVAEVGLVGVVVVLLLWALFPAESGAGGPLASESVFAHAAGLVFGAGCAAFTATRGTRRSRD